jgi:hypothetical protein
MNGVAAAGAKAAGAAGGVGVLHKPPKSLVHTLFGLDVLQARPPADSSSKKAGPAAGAPAAAAAAAAAGSGGAGKDGLLEAQQFMQFFHLVPAQVRPEGHGGVMGGGELQGCSGGMPVWWGWGGVAVRAWNC